MVIHFCFFHHFDELGTIDQLYIIALGQGIGIAGEKRIGNDTDDIQFIVGLTSFCLLNGINTNVMLISFALKAISQTVFFRKNINTVVIAAFGQNDGVIMIFFENVSDQFFKLDTGKLIDFLFIDIETEDCSDR